jgi:tetratricopeptide (TPR) repeat protein
MDCRKLLLLAAGLALSTTGCITQQTNPVTGETITKVWTPLTLFQKEPKRVPKAETCVTAAKTLEQQAEVPQLTRDQKEDKLDQARKAYQQALEIDPRHTQALAGLARVYMQLKDVDRAMSTYEKALKDDPKNGELWFEQAKCHVRQKKFDQAIDGFRKAHEAKPENRTYARHLGLCLARSNRSQEAVQVLAKLHGEAQAHYEVALMLKHLDQTEQARHHTQLALQRDPMLVAAQHLLAQFDGGQAPAPAPESAPSRIVTVGFKAE